MNLSWPRVSAILRKELRDYRRNRFVIGTMAAVPVLFIILPMIQLFAANAIGKHLSVHIGLSLLYMLVIPVMVPSAVSAYSVVGEREQGTLEPPSEWRSAAARTTSWLTASLPGPCN